MPPLGGLTTQQQPTSLTTSQGSSAATTADQSTQAGQNNSTFAPWQQQLQQMLPGLLGSFAQGGQIPQGLVAPPQEVNAANQAFTENVAPNIVAQYGQGSPQLGMQQAYMNQQLSGQMYQQGVGNYLNSLGMLGGFAMNPVGQSYSAGGTDASKQSSTGLGTTSTDTSGTILGMLLQAMRGTVPGMSPGGLGSLTGAHP